MEFSARSITIGPQALMRQIGYSPAYHQKHGEFSIVRKIGRNDYPRFHIYMKSSSEAGNGASTYMFKIHLDQKKPSYEGATGHSGDYDGPVVEQEAERIQKLLDSL